MVDVKSTLASCPWCIESVVGMNVIASWELRLRPVRVGVGVAVRETRRPSDRIAHADADADADGPKPFRISPPEMKPVLTWIPR
jgi:hypothetical protein